MSLIYNINKGTRKYFHLIERVTNHINSNVKEMTFFKRYQIKSVLLGKTCEYSHPNKEIVLSSSLKRRWKYPKNGSTAITIAIKTSDLYFFCQLDFIVAESYLF